jgi:hypothetical protein
VCQGYCDGIDRVGCFLPGTTTECRAAQCVDGVATLQAFCQGTGTCPPEQTQECKPSTCGATQCVGDCLVDSQCISGSYCSAGVCVPKKPAGDACGAGNQCVSGYCADGVCCDTPCKGQCEACDLSTSLGTCAAVTGAPRGGRKQCATDGSLCGGTCNGTTRATCIYPDAGVECRAASCTNDVATLRAFCTGTGTCPPQQTQACNPFTCSGVSCGDCALDGDCASREFCAGGVCVPKLANGQPCGLGNQCASSICVDGVCCDRACIGQCEACDVSGKLGICSAVLGPPHGIRTPCASSGTSCDGVCDGTNGARCSYPGANTVCRPATCSGGLATLEGVCQGNGACAPLQQQPCDPFVCSGTRCGGNCTVDAECGANEFCSSGVCVAKLVFGALCGAASQCASAFCVDGVCCNGACGGQCEACDVVGKLGSCTPFVGQPHGSRPACAGFGPCGGACDGVLATACKLPEPSTVCGSGNCSLAVANDAPLCNGTGSCLPPVSKFCDPYVCGATSCLTSCTGDADCVAGFTCLGGACALPAVDAGLDAGPDSGAGAAAGAPGTGGQGASGGSGGSGGSGATGGAGATDAGIVDAGVDGSAEGGTPKPRPPVIEDDSGCGCRVAGSGANTVSLLLCGLGVLAVSRRRRRIHAAIHAAKM